MGGVNQVHFDAETGPVQVARIRVASAGVVLAICAMTLAGWYLAVPTLANPFPGITMKVNSALALAGLAASVMLSARSGARRGIALALAGAASALALANVLEYGLGIDLRIDQLFFVEPQGVVGTLQAGRMAPNTAVAILAIGAALLLRRAAPRVTVAATCVAGLIGLVAAIDFVFRLLAPEGMELAAYRQMAFLTAVSLILLAVAVLASLPGHLPASILLERGSGGTIARRMIPAAVLIPIALGALRLRGQAVGWYDTQFGTAMMACATSGLFAAVVVWCSVALKKAGDDLVEAHRFLDAVVENIPNMIFVKDAKRLAFVRLNRAGELLLGVSRDAMIGKTDFDFFPSADAEFFQTMDRKALAKGAVVDIPEEKIETASGSRWLHTMKVPVRTSGGAPDFLLGISEDITERRAATDDLRRAKEEAEAANRELESFSYSVSHDLRTPLRAIDGFSQALLEDYAPQLDEVGRGHLERVRRAAQRMSLLIDDLLGLARVTRADLVRERVDLSGLATEIVAELRSRDPSRTVTTTIQPHLAAQADPRLVRAVLENLLGNAWKFTARRPDATIEVVRGDDVDGVASFVIRDDGAGFDVQYADKLFGAFQRLHSTTEFEGTGIGLATVQRIVRRHGGKVWALGDVGRGASFHFTLGSESGPT